MLPANRRCFLTRAGGLTAVAIGSRVGLRSSAVAQQPAQAKNDWPIAIFEKVFEGLSYQELAQAIADIGADGVEATIRPGGHIEPAVAAEEVPKMAEALAAHGKRIVIAATGVRRVDEADTEPLLRTLKAAGIKHYRLGHYHLDLAKPMLSQLREFTAWATDLAQLNAELGLQGLYQNHSGGNSRRGYLGALGWDVAMMLEDIDPDAIGVAFDTRHLRKDTGSSWETAVALCKPHVRSIYVKDGVWKGERGDEYADVPLDTGFVNQNVFDTIRDGLSPMPLCIHMEWLGYRIFPKHEIPAAIEAHQRDIRTLRGWLG